MTTATKDRFDTSQLSDKELALYKALKAVKDPEIPVISVVDLGIITGVSIDAEDKVVIQMTPTFAGCPAIEVMKSSIAKQVREEGYEEVTVEVEFKTNWNSNRITEKGKQQLVEFGLGKPDEHEGEVTMEMVEKAECPFCGSEDTDLQSAFGSALCRSIHYCHSCRQTFERFKPV